MALHETIILRSGEQSPDLINIAYYLLKGSTFMQRNKTSHLQALDDVRVILMLMGIILHAALLMNDHVHQGSTTGWYWLSSTIHVFRMQAFFMISGYLSWKTMTRDNYLTKRTRQLIIPAFSALLILFHVFVDRQLHFHLVDIDFSSIWFLITLYFLVLFNWILWKWNVLSQITYYCKTYPLACIAGAVISQIIISTVHYQCSLYYPWAQSFNIKQVIAQSFEFEFYYLAGLMIAQLYTWQNVLARPIWRWAGLMVWLGWISTTWFYPGIINNMMVSTITSIVIAIAVLSLTTQTKLDLGWTRSLCPASLTVYIWHFPLLRQADKLWYYVGLNHSLVYEFTCISVFALVASLAVHAFIKRSAFLRWMWLGEKWPGLTLLSIAPFLQKSESSRFVR